MDYKNTLLLPKTDFPMRAELPKREPAFLAKWREEKIYEQIMAARKGQPAFILHDGPPFAMPLLLVGASLLETPPIHLILHSPSPEHPGLAPLLAVARRRYLPQMVVIQIADEDSRDYFAPRHAVIENLPAQAAEPTAYLCENFACRLPVTKPENLREIISSL